MKGRSRHEKHAHVTKTDRISAPAGQSGCGSYRNHMRQQKSTAAERVCLHPRKQDGRARICRRSSREGRCCSGCGAGTGRDSGKGNRTRSKGQQRSTRTAFLCLGGRSGAALCDNRSDRHEGKDDDGIYDLRNPAKSRDPRRTHRNDRDEDRGKKHSVRKYNAGACCAAEAVF